MYNQKLAVAIKSSGKVLREFKDTVYVPFSSEYSILIKNLNTVRAIVNVFIDGEDMVPGGLVLNAGQEVDLERSIKNGNLNEGNRFKFIERTAGVEKHRGIKLEDGVVRVEYQFEKVYQRQDGVQWDQVYYKGGHYGGPLMGSAIGSSQPMFNVNGTLRSVDYSKGETVRAMAASATAEYCSTNNIVNKSDYHEGMATMDCCFNDAGITVPGSKSEQKFSTASWFATEATKHSIVLKLLGETLDNKPVVKPVTVKHKPECLTCGRKNKATAKFCQDCGTSLEIFA